MAYNTKVPEFNYFDDQIIEAIKQSNNEGPDLGGISAFKVLEDRKNWLAARIKAKQSVGWETTYDQREHDALVWALKCIK